VTKSRNEGGFERICDALDAVSLDTLRNNVESDSLRLQVCGPMLKSCTIWKCKVFKMALELESIAFHLRDTATYPHTLFVYILHNRTTSLLLLP
jgi:hypothetical protein